MRKFKPSHPLSSLAACVLALAASLPLHAADSTPTAAISLAQALQAARDNLDVSLANRAVNAAQADILAANRAPQPVLSAKVGQIDFQNGFGPGNPLTQKRFDKGIGIDWTLERGNKRALRTRVAERSAAAALADVDDVRSQQLLAAWSAFYDVLSAQDRVTQVQAIAQSAAQLASTAAKRVAAGDLSAQEAARTAIEADRAKAEITLATIDLQRATVALSQLLHQPQQIVQGTGERFALQALPDWPALITTEAMSEGALNALIEKRGDVRAAQERIQAALANLDNNSALKKSDITVGSAIDHYPGTSTRLLEVRMQMPLQWNYHFEGEIARAQAQITQAQDAHERVRLLAAHEMQRLQQELIGAALRAQAYAKDILPRATQVAASAESAYSKGAISLTDLLDARRTLRATLIEALNAKTDHAKALGAWQLRTDPQSLPGRLASNAIEQPKP